MQQQQPGSLSAALRQLIAGGTGQQAPAAAPAAPQQQQARARPAPAAAAAGKRPPAESLSAFLAKLARREPQPAAPAAPSGAGPPEPAAGPSTQPGAAASSAGSAGGPMGPPAHPRAGPPGTATAAISARHAQYHAQQVGQVYPQGEQLPADSEAEFEADARTAAPSSEPRPQMRHRLRKHSRFWASIVCSTLVMSWILSGVPLLWKDGAPPPAWARNHASAEQNAAFVDTAVAALVASASAMRVPHRPTVVSPLGVVERNGKFRLIWDGRYVNEHIQCPTFKYETLDQLGTLLQPGDWLATADLTAGFHHLDVEEAFWQYLGFEWRGAYYVFTQLPFGLCIAPWAFTKLTRQLLYRWRGKGWRCTSYIDDWLLAASSAEELLAMVQQLRADFDAAGFVANYDKCRLDPAQQQQYLGMLVDTVAGTLWVPQAKRDRLVAHIRTLLQRRRGAATARELQVVAGQIQAMSPSFGHILTRLFTRGMRNAISAAGPQLDRHHPLPPAARAELQFWPAAFERCGGKKPLWADTNVHTVIHTDAAGASDVANLGGWGAWTHAPDRRATRAAAGRWTPPTSLHPEHHSTWLEVKAATLGLQSFNRAGELRGQRVQLVMDNQAAVQVVNNGSAAGDGLHELAVQLFYYTLEQGITLTATWVPREQNARADALSKVQDTSDWMLHPRRFAQLSAQWGPFEVDLFASHTNHQVPTYFSRFHTPDTAGVDAFGQWWGRACWCNPPFSLMARILQHAQRCQARMCLIVPFWPTTPWWHRLVQRRGTAFASFVQAWQPLPRRQDTFLPGTSGNRLHKGPPLWEVLALLVDFAPGAQRSQPLQVPHELRQLTGAGH